MEDSSNKPAWPYTLGTLGASVFALGMLLAFVAFAPRGGPDIGRAGFILAGVGSSMLGIAWSRLLRVGQGGVGQIMACFAVPAALLFLATRSGYDGVQTAVLVLCLSLCGFALAHLFTSRLTAVRWASGVSLLGMFPVTLSVTGKVNIPGADQLLMLIGFGGLCAVGILLAVGMSALKRAAEDPYQL